MAADADSLKEQDIYTTAEEAFPLRIHLEEIEIAGYRYTSSNYSDIELLYELKTSDILVKTVLHGSRDGKPGTYRIRGIQAARLDLINQIPGSLEGIACKLIIEADQCIEFENLVANGNKKTSKVETGCCRAVLTASIHECGHLRDILLFLKSENVIENIATESLNPYLKPSQHSLSPKVTKNGMPSLTYLEILPWWSTYLPWWLYSRRIRQFLQRALFLYSLFSIVWATWQLYRHVHLIQVVLQPIVELLQFYLSGIMTFLDEFLSSFTHYWTSLFSPLNVLRGLLLMPVFQVAVTLKNVLLPVAAPLLKVFNPLVKAFNPLMRSLSVIWQSVLSSRIAVQSLDMMRVRQNMVFSLLVNSFKAIGKGVTYLVGYRKEIKKQKQAEKVRSELRATPTTGFNSPTFNSVGGFNRHRNPRRSIPVYYSSPLTKPIADDHD